MSIPARAARRTQGQRSAETRARLLDATIDCLVTYGYNGTTTPRVAEMAGVTRGAQVHHFGSKNDLVIAALQHPLRARYFASASPYVSVAVAALLCSPHIWWLVSSGAPPLHYLAHVSGHKFSAIAAQAATAFFGALAQNGIVFAVVAIVARVRPSEAMATISRRWSDPQFHLLAILAATPLVLTVLAGLLP